MKIITWLKNNLDERSFLKRILKFVYHLPGNIIGISICTFPLFAGYERYLLSTWYDRDKRNKLDHMIFPCVFNNWVRLKYLKEPNPDRREELKSLALGGISGKNWAAEYDSRPVNFDSTVGSMPFDEACPIFSEIEMICKDGEGDLALVQLGSSSGREIAYFAKKFPKVQCIGCDIYEEVIDYSRQSHYFPNLSFRLASAKSIAKLLSSCVGKNIVMFSSGSLQYVQPEHLNSFFKALNEHPGLRVFLLEPGDESQGEPDKLEKSIWRGNFSYTHDYKFYAEGAGMETVKCKIIHPYVPYTDFPMHKNTVHYFYHGQSERILKNKRGLIEEKAVS